MLQAAWLMAFNRTDCRTSKLTDGPIETMSTPKETLPKEQAEFSASNGSASELLAKWKQALEERHKAVSNRLDNMFYGPIGIEERTAFLENDARMNAWFLDKLIKVVCDLEAKMPND